MKRLVFILFISVQLLKAETVSAKRVSFELFKLKDFHGNLYVFKGNGIEGHILKDFYASKRSKQDLLKERCRKYDGNFSAQEMICKGKGFTLILNKHSKIINAYNFIYSKIIKGTISKSALLSILRSSSELST